MALLGHIKISNRLALAIALPVLVAFGLAGQIIWTNWTERGEMAQLSELADGVSKISRLVHELQRERGISAVFLSSKGAQMRGELSEQRKRTDDERRTVSLVMRSFAALGSREIGNAVAAAETSIST